jgi:hypothetical protein
MSKIAKRISAIENRMQKDRQKVFTLKAQETRRMQKQRTRKLIQIGGLFEIVGLTELDPGVILGLLMESQERLKDEVTYRNLKRLGDAELNRRAQERKAKRTAQKKTSGQAA